MPKLIPTRLFLKDMERFRSNAVIRKKVVKALALLEANPLHPGLHLERIINDPSACLQELIFATAYPGSYLPAGNPEWSTPITLLRILDHDDLYKSPR